MSFDEQGRSGRGKRGQEHHRVSDPNFLPPPELPSELMTTTEVATLVRRTPRTIRNWIRDEILTPIDLPGPRLFRRVDVERLIGRPSE